MFRIKFYKKDNTPLTMLDTYAWLEFENNLNQEWKWKLTLSYNDKHLSDELLKFWVKIEIYHIWENIIKVFDGIISSFDYTEQLINIYFIDYISYIKYRILREDKSYSWTAVKDIITDLYNYFNDIEPLWFDLWLNDIEDSYDFSFSAGQTFLQILQTMVKTIWEFRIKDKKLDYSNQVWETKTWIFKYDINSLAWSNIDKYDIQFWLDSFANSVLISDWDTKTLQEDQNSINEIWLFERYVYNPNGDDNLWFYLTDIKVPKLTLSNKVDFTEYSLWDRQRVYIDNWLEFLKIDYMWVIIWMKYKVNNWLITCEIKTPDKYLITMDLWNYLKILNSRVSKLEV